MNVKKHITWQAADGSGKEVLSIKQAGSKITVASKAKGGDSDLHTTWDVTYSLTCDTNWKTHSVIIDEHQSGHHLELKGDGKGRWTDAKRRELKEVAGCIDIDFRATPFSNTLPIRRLELAVGDTASIDVLYINAPDLAVSRQKQMYTRLSENSYMFEQPSANFVAFIVVDDEGFVVTYPGLFHRE